MSETVKSAKEIARFFMQKGIALYTEGPPGVGKSEMWQQIAAEEEMGFIDLRLAQLDPVDLRGLPALIKSGTCLQTTWARPDMWPQEERDGKRGIMLLDELGDCGKAMQSAAYQVVLDGKAGPHMFPSGWYRCAAGNSQKHKAGAQAISSALANRFAWLDIEADANCFREYGNIVGYHHYVLNFIRSFPDKLHSMEGAMLRAFPTPRAWSKVSKVCDAPPQLLYKLVAAIVGDGVAGEFCAYIKTLHLPDFDDIIKDPKGTMIPKDPSSKYALASMIARYTTRQNLSQVMTYIRRSEFGRDFEIACALDASKRDSSICEHKAWIEFANRNQDLQL